MLKQTNIYRGKAKVAIKKGNQVIHTSTHNAGLSDMSYLFAKAVTGNLDFQEDLPRLIDVGYIVPATEASQVNPGDNGVWVSILNAPVVIGGRQYSYSKELKNWVGTFTATIYYSDINGGIIDNVKENLELGNYELRVRLCSYPSLYRKYFAEFNPDSSFIDDIRDSTSAIIIWDTELLTTNTVTTPIAEEVEEAEEV